MATTPSFTTKQLHIITNSLAAISPSGGGSPQHSLLLELSRAGFEPELTETIRLQRIAANELADSNN